MTQHTARKFPPNVPSPSIICRGIVVARMCQQEKPLTVSLQNPQPTSQRMRATYLDQAFQFDRNNISLAARRVYRSYTCGACEHGTHTAHALGSRGQDLRQLLSLGSAPEGRAE